MKKILTSVFSIIAISLFSQNTVIHLNQIGFYPTAQKLAVVVYPLTAKKYQIINAKGSVALAGVISGIIINKYSKKPQAIIDFTNLKLKGEYYVLLENGTKSPKFLIGNNIHDEVAKASIKGYYYQRCSKELTPQYAGKWARPLGHADDSVYIHASAASAHRKEGTIISSTKGWYDAGDYNKYIINSGISTATLMSLHEDYTAYSQSLKVNIPEEGNSIPDLLDEVKWNLDWMLTMQDPHDGGVYHKLTNENFDGMNLMPHRANKKRYVIYKNTTAALDFAATMAQAYRVYKPYNKVLNGFADTCLARAKYAWEWAIKNPNILYNQNEHNKIYKPAINTGAYGDHSCKDEWIWAAAELWATTNDEKYISTVDLFPDKKYRIAFWNDVRILAYYTLVRMEKNLKLNAKIGTLQIAEMKNNITQYADSYLKELNNQAFHTIMGKDSTDWSWGSTAVAANQGILMLYAYRINSTNSKYLNAALDNLDLLMGRNATGYNFLTGFGQKKVMNIHHRPSESDGVVDPVPGLLSGGPNPKMQDKCEGYPSTYADECFLDHSCSYASNEICLNWNAPLVYLAGAIEAIYRSK
jgi:endoglucanase